MIFFGSSRIRFDKAMTPKKFQFCPKQIEFIKVYCSGIEYLVKWSIYLTKIQTSL